MTDTISPKELLGKALGRIPSGISILTAHADNQDSALLASWFQQIAFEPPMISIAIQNDRPILGMIRQTKQFTLNLLHHDQKKFLGHFGKGFAPGENPFMTVDVTQTEDKGAVLNEAMAYLFCSLREEFQVANQVILIGEVLEGKIQHDHPSMVHLRKSGFHY